MDEYKKYSLEQLENWMHDAMSAGEATPQEIYDVIRGVVEENYYTYKHQTSQAYELLALLNGNGKGHLSCDRDDQSEECKKSWTSFWEENYYPEEYKEPKVEDIMPPWGHSDMEALRYSDEELNAMCDKAELDAELKKIEEEGGYEWTPPVNHSKYYYEYDRNDPNRENPFVGKKIYESPDGGKTVYSRTIGKEGRTLVKEEKQKKWILPVEQVHEDYYVSFPDELLKAANIREGDIIEWIDNGDGSYLLKKVPIMYHPV